MRFTTSLSALVALGLAAVVGCGDHASVEVSPRVVAVSVTAGDSFSCAGYADRQVHCWGSGEAPMASAPAKNVDRLAGDLDLICAGGVESGPECWSLQTSVDRLSEWLVPVRIRGAVTSADWTASGDFLCVADRVGRRACGSVHDGEVALSVRDRAGALPRRAIDGGCAIVSTGVMCADELMLRDPDLKQISASFPGGCGLRDDGRVRCWGDRVLQGVEADPAARFAQISVGGSSACGIALSDEILCWGMNTFGVLGNGEYGDGPNETARGVQPIRSDRRFSRVSVSENGHACGITIRGSVMCWGNNSSYQLGIGSKEQTTDVVSVIEWD